MSWNWCQLLGKHDFWAKICSRAKIDRGGSRSPPPHTHTWRALSDVTLARVKTLLWFQIFKFDFWQFCCPLSHKDAQFSEYRILKLKFDLQRTSVLACLVYKHEFSAPFKIFDVKMEFYFILCNAIVHCKPNGGCPIWKPPFPNGRYCNGVCRRLGAQSAKTFGTC